LLEPFAAPLFAKRGGPTPDSGGRRTSEYVKWSKSVREKFGFDVSHARNHFTKTDGEVHHKWFLSYVPAVLAVAKTAGLRGRLRGLVARTPWRARCYLERSGGEPVLRVILEVGAGRDEAEQLFRAVLDRLYAPEDGVVVEGE